jgi:hypothetical protein
MNNNQEVIEQIREQSAPFMERLTDRATREFRLKDLDINEHGLFLKDMPITSTARTKVLGMLRVKKNFSEFANKMTPEDWRSVSAKLKNAEGDTKLYATISKDDHGNPEIIDAHPHRDGKKHSDDATYQQYFNWIEDSLGKSEKNYSLKNLNFNSRNEMTELILLNENDRVDVFGTDLDLWKMGDRFHFNGVRFNYAPFFERLVCSNGNTATEFGFGADISKNTFNNNKIQGVISKAIEFGSETMPATLAQAVQHLQKNNVSLAEFYQYRNFFESRNGEEVYNGIIEKYFNDKPFYQGYGLNINEKSRKWKSTANSGINAYDFFNMLTWVASHPDQVRMDKNDRVQLQINASNLLFKKELDLEDVATSTNIVYPRLTAMN